MNKEAIDLLFLIPIAVIIAAAIVGIAFWDDIKPWVERFWEAVKRRFTWVVNGVKIFVKKTRDALQEILKYYHQDKQGQWHETVTMRNIDVSQVPEDVMTRARATTNEVDITSDVNRVLKLNI